MLNIRANAAVVLVVVLVVSAVGAPLAATGTVVAQNETADGNETTAGGNETTGTPTAAECENPEVPEMDQARLYAPEKIIESGQPGRIDGGFKLDNTMQCPVKVVVTLRVPSGASISGGSDWQSAGAGLVSTSFTMRPGSGVHDLSANVYSQRTGDRRVTGDIEYWPAGSPELSNEIDGLSFNFDVREPNPENGSGGIPIDIDPIVLMAILAGLAIVGLVIVAPKVGIELRK